MLTLLLQILFTLTTIIFTIDFVYMLYLGFFSVSYKEQQKKHFISLVVNLLFIIFIPFLLGLMICFAIGFWLYPYVLVMPISELIRNLILCSVSLIMVIELFYSIYNLQKTKEEYEQAVEEYIQAVERYKQLTGRHTK